jgi:uncharacterized protein YbjT (DUF2867 family)
VRVILFGATGMVGQGVLRECLLDPQVSAVLSVVRRSSAGGPGAQNKKVRELVVEDFYDFSAIKSELAGYDACFFCLGVSSFRMKEPEYRRITYDITTAAARAVLQANPTSSSGGMTFIYVSGLGTDAQGRSMWAQVKGATENALLAMPFKAAYMFRPGGIVAMHRIQSKTAVYRITYFMLDPMLRLLRMVSPKYVTTTEQVGRAMLAVAKHGYPKQVLEGVDLASF